MALLIRSAQRRSLVSQVEDELHSALIEGRLKPGARLITRDLAVSLGTSITPVREALVRLVSTGALRAEPAQSFRVPVLTCDEVRELARVRKAVEGLAAFEAADRIVATQIDHMERLLGEYLRARSQIDPHHALRANRQFRFALYECARMPHLLQLVETLWLKSGPGFNHLFPQQQNEFAGHRNYENLLRSLREGNGNAARAAIEQAIDDGAAAEISAMSSRMQTPCVPA